jgi:hypothetical protein
MRTCFWYCSLLLVFGVSYPSCRWTEGESHFDILAIFAEENSVARRIPQLLVLSGSGEILRL